MFLEYFIRIYPLYGNTVTLGFDDLNHSSIQNSNIQSPQTVSREEL